MYNEMVSGQVWCSGWFYTVLLFFVDDISGAFDSVFFTEVKHSAQHSHMPGIEQEATKEQRVHAFLEEHCQTGQLKNRIEIDATDAEMLTFSAHSCSYHNLPALLCSEAPETFRALQFTWLFLCMGWVNPVTTIKVIFCFSLWTTACECFG